MECEIRLLYELGDHFLFKVLYGFMKLYAAIVAPVLQSTKMRCMTTDTDIAESLSRLAGRCMSLLFMSCDHCALYPYLYTTTEF